MSRGSAIILFVLAGALTLLALFWFLRSAPPRTLIITSGPPGSTFQRNAEKYRDILSSNGVSVQILPSQGSLENLERLGDPAFQVDVGFAQAGQSNGSSRVQLLSLGSVSYQPLLIFYRSATPLTLLSDFAGRRLAIGPPGSGSRTLALILLATNGVTGGGSNVFVDLDATNAAKALLDQKVDAVFLMGDSASVQTMRLLLQAPGIQMFDFAQADAYTRRFAFLNKLQLPRGGIDFARDAPAHDLNLIGPTVELVARSSLHPALSDLLLEAAQEVHGKASLLQRKNEFPAPLEHELKISPDALRYYKSGKRFLYRALPFWLASLVNRTLVAFLPLLLVLIPGLRYIPIVYRWRIQLRIYRWYRRLLRVERSVVDETAPGSHEDLQRELDEIETSVNAMKVPASFAGQFYVLREHIDFVRERLDLRQGREPG